MDGLIKRFCKYLFKILIVDIFLTVLAFIISYFSKINISDILLYVGILCMIIGMLSVLGNSNNSVDATYFISKSAGTKSINEITEENYKNRNSSLRFLVFMSCVGGFFITIVVVMDLVLK